MNFEDLKNPELHARLKACKTAEELVALAEEHGIVLSDAQLESITGGEWKNPCPDASHGPL